MVPEECKTFVRRAWDEVLNRHHVDAFGQFFALPAMASTRDLLLGFLAAFPDATVTYDEQVAEGTTVASRVHYHGTQRRPFMGVAPTGRRVASASIGFDRIGDGKIVDHVARADWLGLRRQLADVQPPEHEATSVETAKALVRRSNEELYNQHDLAALDRYFALEPGPAAAYKRVLSEFFAGFPTRT